MDRRQWLKMLGITTLGGFCAKPLALGQMFSVSTMISSTIPVTDAAYLMAYFKSDNQQLFYAISQDGKNWRALNGDQPVLQTEVNLRDPFIGRAGDKFHLVHTKGWDYPVIYHYTSKDLIDWQGGPIQVVTADKKRAWAPEWYYEEKEGLFYVFWASLFEGHNAIFYTKTKDWTDIRPGDAKVYYDLGIDDIDFTVVKATPGPEGASGYYGFHKPGSLKDNFPIQCLYSPTLDQAAPDFGFGKKASPVDAALPDMVLPIEGPEIIQLNGTNKWYIYGDPFHQSFICWETTDFKHFQRIKVKVPAGSKHCSIMSITTSELTLLKKKFPL